MSETRCKHGVDGKDCFTCFPSKPKSATQITDRLCEYFEWDKGSEHAMEIENSIKEYGEQSELEAYRNAEQTWKKEIEKARAEALEEAAQVAETIYGTRFHDKIEVRTGRKIASNIRALKSHTPHRGGHASESGEKKGRD